MKTLKIYLYISIMVFALLLSACEKMLEEPVYSQLAPENFLTTSEGISSVLDAALGEGFINGYDNHSVRDILNWCTDIEWETGGGENRTAVLMIDFTWDASIAWMYDVMWRRPYRAIRNANTVLDNIDNANVSSTEKTTYTAEARFIRALSYYHLYTWFGPVPLRKSTLDDLELPRATKEEMESFIESELTAVIPNLPEPGEEAAYARPNAGAARALLCKYYLNTKQWSKCADMANQVINMDYYELYPNYMELFMVQNERNKEFIMINPEIPKAPGQNFINGAFPTGFAKDPKSGLEMQSNWNNWAAQYRLYDSFYNSFEPDDSRKDLIISEYINGKW